MLRELLAREGIACIIRNEQLFVAMGEIPMTECFPELWVIDDEVYPRAKMLTERLMRVDENEGPWSCPDCLEEHEGQFGSCWRCGRQRY